MVEPMKPVLNRVSDLVRDQPTTPMSDDVRAATPWLPHPAPRPSPAAEPGIEGLVERLNKGHPGVTTGNDWLRIWEATCREAASALTRLARRAEVAEACLEQLHGPLSVAALTARADTAEARLEAAESRMRELEAERERLTTAIERAYGILWRDHSAADKAVAARKELLSVTTKDGQKRGIEHATRLYGPTTETEILGDRHMTPLIDEILAARQSRAETVHEKILLAREEIRQHLAPDSPGWLRKAFDELHAAHHILGGDPFNMHMSAALTVEVERLRKALEQIKLRDQHTRYIDGVPDRIGGIYASIANAALSTQQGDLPDDQ